MHSNEKVALRSAESQLQVVCTSEFSLQKQVSRLKLDKNRLEDQCELEDRLDSRTHDLMDGTSQKL